MTDGATASSRLAAAIFGVDGVLLASPHEQAWRDALSGLADPARFTTALYQAAVAGKPRMSGALAALEALGVPDPGRQMDGYAARKQARLETLIADGQVAAYPDALRFVAAVAALGWPMAAASSFKNADAMLRQIRLDDGRDLLGLFDANVCGRDLRHGKPDPGIVQVAAEELNVAPGRCFVAEDAPAGMQAARANIVMESLDGVCLAALAGGLLETVA